MSEEAKDAFVKTALGAKNTAYDVIAALDPEYFEKLKGLYVDGTFGREGALPRKTKELIMVGICCALLRPRGIRVHSERALTLGAAPKEVLEAMEVARIEVAAAAGVAVANEKLVLLGPRPERRTLGIDHRQVVAQSGAPVHLTHPTPPSHTRTDNRPYRCTALLAHSALGVRHTRRAAAAPPR